jgi:lipopolysaccharide/colanic/teichoic acid biosynthesis glycosyltransferase/glycosyltransferase involved in cell wall biosynthesis
VSDVFKVLQVTAIDVTVKKLLLPLIDRLTAEGYQVHVACSDGQYVPELREQGYNIHVISIPRRLDPVAILKSLWRLYRLMKKERFDVVHVHTMIASVVGRLAVWAAGVPVVIYTAHGFYFHENMSWWTRRLTIWLEKILGLITDLIFTQSQEDAVSAVKESICRAEKVVCIGNGVDTSRFDVAPSSPDEVRARYGLTPGDKVIGFVGRFVREKGILELLQAMQIVNRAIPESRLLLVGGTLQSDRDSQIKKIISRVREQNQFSPSIVFTGFIEDITAPMSVMDVFVLPSHREGMPRSIIEAMASGKPVIATNIRGCREEVVHGSTGLIVPLNNPSALAEAIINVLINPDMGRRMGAAGRLRADKFFNERSVLDKQVEIYTVTVKKGRLPRASLQTQLENKRIQLAIKRIMDVSLSLVSLILLLPLFMIIGLLIKIDSKGPVFFRQERAGRRGKPFLIWKFRTMIKDAPNHGLGLNVSKDDPRLTRVGRVLRKWSFDELPQLINVLAGEMSIVGPRTGLLHQVERYNGDQRQRLLVRPGISSLPLILGRNLLSWKERIDLDIQYLSHWSLWLDLRIIFKTFWVVLVTRKGIYGPAGINDDFNPVSPPDIDRKPGQSVTLPGAGSPER